MPKYDQCTQAVLARECQLTSTSLKKEAVTPINLTNSVDVELLQANIGLGLLEAKPYADLTEDMVGEFREERCGESKKGINIDQLY